ncbi:MAG: ABC transporter permease [Gemmatimonadales bacterium]
MISLRNVLRAPARSLLTALGVGAGVGLFVAITAIILDVRQQIAGAIRTYNMEVVIYERRANSPFTSRISPAQMAELQARYGAALSPIVLGTRNERWNSYAMVIGVRPDLLVRIPLTGGARFEEGKGEAMLGEIAAERLGLGPGDQVTLDERPFRISGVYRMGSRLFDGGVMMEIPEAQRTITRQGAEPQYTLAVLRAGPGPVATRLIADINRQFPALRAIRGTEFAGALRLLRVVDAFVRTISVVALVGTALVVSNTFLMAIANRTREIGILMAMGWTPWLVLRMLFLESLMLCGAGAVIGNGFALVLLRVVNGIPAIGFGWIPIRYPLSLAGGSLVMAFAVAVLALAWPAVVLYRMQPLAALRHE